MICAVGSVLFILAGVLLWGLVRGAALCLSPAERAVLDDEQAHILAQMNASRGHA